MFGLVSQSALDAEIKLRKQAEAKFQTEHDNRILAEALQKAITQERDRLLAEIASRRLEMATERAESKETIVEILRHLAPLAPEDQPAKPVELPKQLDEMGTEELERLKAELEQETVIGRTQKRAKDSKIRQVEMQLQKKKTEQGGQPRPLVQTP